MRKFLFGLAAIMVFLSLGISSCVNDTTSTHPMSLTSDNTLTNEDLQFLSRYTNEGKRMSPEQAANIAIISTPATRSSGVSVTRTDAILKQSIEYFGDSIGDLLPDTLIYLVSTSDGYCYAIPADGRVSTHILGRVPQGQVYDITNDVDWTIRDMVYQMFTNTVIKEIIDYETTKDSLKAVVLNKLNLAETSTTRGLQPPSFTPDEYEFFMVYGSTTPYQVGLRNPMTPWNWHQQMPYNRFVKNKLSCGTVPTGCVPLSVGLLMTYWGHPSVVDGHYLGWNQMRGQFNSYDSTHIGAVDIAYLMQHIGEGINADYQCEGTGAYLSTAISWLHNHGYQGGSQTGFSYNSVKSSLNNERPVLISGYRDSGSGGTIGHAWVIDGYEEIRYDTQVFIYARNLKTGEVSFVREDVEHTYQYYLCNNFGNNNAQSWISSTNYLNFNFNQGTGNYQYNVCVYTELRPN